MKKDHLQNLAFQIISESGDALDEFYQGIKAIKKQEDPNLIRESYDRGQKHLHTVHNLQTELITAEANEEELPYSLIMVHAQDHLNSAINWGRMCKLLMETKEDIQ